LVQQPDWEATFRSFYKLLDDGGYRYSFIDVDFNWRDPALTTENINIEDPVKISSRAEQFTEFVRRNYDISLGIILNGKADATTDKQWTEEAKENVALIEHAIRFDRAVFQSWHTHPIKSLPETEPGSFTNLVKWYAESHTVP
jgi:hypothetical protein